MFYKLKVCMYNLVVTDIDVAVVGVGVVLLHPKHAYKAVQNVSITEKKKVFFPSIVNILLVGHCC